MFKWSKLSLLMVVILFSQFAKAEISLKDLGVDETPVSLTPAQVKQQEVMEVRHSKLKTHEKLGLVTLGLMTATLLTGNSALDSNMHMYLGMTTGLLYYTTAYYSLTAPKPAGIVDRGAIKWHKALAWIHFPAMVLAPILGYMYKRNEDNGKKSSSLVKQHSAIAGIGFGAFALSATLMTIEF